MIQKYITSAYFALDTRALAIGRIALALVMLLDLAKRFAVLDLWYTNDGLLPNHTVLWRPNFSHSFSFFFMASYWHEAVIGFAICAWFYLQLLFGWKTKIAQIGSFLCVLSLHSRTAFVNNGGDIVLSELALWSMFLPTGERYSIDAADRSRSPAATARSLACVALLLQFVCIYLFNAVHKCMPGSWLDGSTVHYVLHQDRIVTALGAWAREILPIGISRMMTWGALFCEFVIVALLLSPLMRNKARSIAVLLVWALHFGFGLFLNVGIFSPAMMAFGLNFLPSETMDWIERKLGVIPLKLAEEHRSLDLGSKLQEALVAFFLLTAATQVFVDSNLFRYAFRFPQPRIFAAVASYAQLFQGWQMFAPDAPRNDMTIVVEARTRGGAIVDPFNQRLARVMPARGQPVPSRMGYDSFACDYAAWIAGRREYHQAFTEWIWRQSPNSGNPSDEFVSFEVYEIFDRSPLPGSWLPTEPTSRLILKGTR